MRVDQWCVVCVWTSGVVRVDQWCSVRVDQWCGAVWSSVCVRLSVEMGPYLLVYQLKLTLLLHAVHINTYIRGAIHAASAKQH